MLGDIGRAEDVVQEAWLRWEHADALPESPRAYLVTIVTRLCLNELDSARARHLRDRAVVSQSYGARELVGGRPTETPRERTDALSSPPCTSARVALVMR